MHERQQRTQLTFEARGLGCLMSGPTSHPGPALDGSEQKMCQIASISQAKGINGLQI